MLRTLFAVLLISLSLNAQAQCSSCEWITPTFAASNFTGTDGMVWTVDATDVNTFAYVIIGKTMIVSFDIALTSISGTPSNELHIAVPGSKVPKRAMYNTFLIGDNGPRTTGYVECQPGNPNFLLYRTDAANFSASTNLTQVRGQLVCEIE